MYRKFKKINYTRRKDEKNSFSTIIFAMSILFFMQKYDIKKDINDYLIVDIEFTGNPRMYGKKILK